MNTVKNDQPKVSASIVKPSRRFLSNTTTIKADNTFQSQQELRTNAKVHAKHVLGNDISRANALLSVESYKKSTKTKNNKRKEQWSIGEYEHFWNQIDDLRRSYNDQPDDHQRPSSISNRPSSTRLNVSSKKNSISFGPVSCKMQENKMQGSFKPGTNVVFLLSA